MDEATFPRRRKRPRRYEEGTSEGDFPAVAKDLYRQKYFEVLDLAVVIIIARFDQPGFKVYSNIKQLLFKACSGKQCNNELDTECNLFTDDLSRCDLVSQLKVLHSLYVEKKQEAKPTVAGLREVLASLSPSQRNLIDMVCHTFKLLLVIPATNSTSERSFSALKRIKTYLRSSMLQSRLNHLMVLHYHQKRTDNLDLNYS